MSLLWRDEIGIHVAPGRVCLVRLKRGVKPTQELEHELAVSPQVAGHWSAALSAIAALLEQPQWSGAVARVVLADCWARYAIVPWTSDLTSSGERLAHARQLLQSAYGEAVVGWAVRMSDAPPGVGRVACALPSELLDAVTALFERSSARLLSLQPQLTVAYGSWRGRLPRSGAWFVTAGDGTLAAARVAGNGWDRVHTARIGADWARELKRLQTFGRLASSAPGEGHVYVDAPLAWRDVAAADGQPLHWLEDEAVPTTTLQHLQRLRRLAA